MAKRNTRREKALRNLEYAERFRKKKTRRNKRVPKYASWCRVKGHPASCQCVYL